MLRTNDQTKNLLTKEEEMTEIDRIVKEEEIDLIIPSVYFIEYSFKRDELD